VAQEIMFALDRQEMARAYNALAPRASVGGLVIGRPFKVLASFDQLWPLLNLTVAPFEFAEMSHRQNLKLGLLLRARVTRSI